MSPPAAPLVATALVMGGAKCVHEDLEVALSLCRPDVFIAVKDIGIVYYRVDHWVTFHADRIANELAKRRSLGNPDPKCIWVHKRSHVAQGVNVPIERILVKGGSSGMMGALVGLRLARKVVLAGVPMDPGMPHFNDRKHGKPWHEGRLYQSYWRQCLPDMKDRVRSLSGWTKELLGEPTPQWLSGS